MHGSKTKSIRWLLLLAVFFIAVSFTARPAFAAPSDFEDLTGAVSYTHLRAHET